MAQKKCAKVINEITLDGRNRLGISFILLTEFYAGAGPEENRMLNKWVGSAELDVFFLDHVSIARQAGELRKNDLLSFADAIILAHAMALKATLLTFDADFERRATHYAKTLDLNK